MKKISIIITSIIFVCIMSDSLMACTSFAVYSNQVYYGMNFDFLNIPMKFLISTQGDINTFHLAFERVIGDMKFFVNTAGMNTRGLFASCQELYPTIENPPAKTEKNLFTFELYDAIGRCSSVKEILSICKKKPLIDMADLSLHNLFADIYGMAAVTEAGDEKSAAITEMKKNKFIVMTNFPNYLLTDNRYPDDDKNGADRYIMCHEYLNENIGNFTIDHGLRLLEKAYNRDPEYQTVCSMLFDPKNLKVYVVLYRDFKHVWQISLADKIIREFRGFQTLKEYNLDEKGIMISELLSRG